jgi:hypothetical protein
VSFDSDVFAISDDSNILVECDVLDTCDEYDLHASTAFDTYAVSVE